MTEDTFAGMLDLAWQDFKTYREPGSPAKPMGIVVILVGDDGDHMTISTGANLPPDIVEAALLSMAMGFSSGTARIRQVRPVRRKRVV